MLSFEINQQKCTGCCECMQDCPVRIIYMDQGYPAIKTGKESSCLKCQHCLAVCPTGALSILGMRPEDSIILAGNLPEPERLETLIKGRRSVRRYLNEDLEPGLLDKLIEVANYAPTGVNSREVLFSVIDDWKTMAGVREDTLEALAELAREGKLPPENALFADFVRLWEEKGIDVIFRGAPHMIAVSAPKESPTPEADCLIALSSFDLYAQSLGVGTVWNGYAKWIYSLILPQFGVKLGIPENHILGYVMVFGKPAVTYQRTVQHPSARVARVKW